MRNLKWPESLYWLIPVIMGAVCELMFIIPALVSPDTLNHHKEILVLLIPLCIVAPLGGWWAVYQCIRHEEHPAKYLLIVILVPLGFTWYYFERYRGRGPTQIARRS